MPNESILEKLSEGPVDYYSLHRCPVRRPCRKVNCRHHLAIYWKSRGSVVRPRLTYPEAELKELPETCALDVAQKYDGLTLADVGLLLNITQERVRQIEFKALRKIRKEMSNVVKVLDL